MFLKILAFVAVLFVIYILFFKNRKKNDDGVTQNFVECGKCGTFVEAKDAVLSNGKYICDECIKIAKKG